jgi:hypothetical protein
MSSRLLQTNLWMLYGQQIISDIFKYFSSILEAKFIDENIIKGDTLGYKRYLNDVFSIVNKSEKTIFSENKQFT